MIAVAYNDTVAAMTWLTKLPPKDHDMSRIRDTIVHPHDVITYIIILIFHVRPANVLTCCRCSAWKKNSNVTYILYTILCHFIRTLIVACPANRESACDNRVDNNIIHNRYNLFSYSLGPPATARRPLQIQCNIYLFI